MRTSVASRVRPAPVGPWRDIRAYDIEGKGGELTMVATNVQDPANEDSKHASQSHAAAACVVCAGSRR